MELNSSLRNRKLGLTGGKISLDFAINKIRLKEAIKLSRPEIGEDSELKTFGPLACAKLGNQLVAIANEDGFIDLLQTSQLKEKAHWLGHDNAVFDIKALPDLKTIVTASGDTTVRQWDVETKKEILMLSAHHSSVKSISVYDCNIVASGSRDGTIKVHDLRSKKPTKIEIRDAHRNVLLSKCRKVTAKTDPVSCVTNVAFDNLLPRVYSTGANDATIKLWDLRNYKPSSKPRRTRDGRLIINQANMEVHHPSQEHYCGYSHLLLSSGKVYAACSDNKIYCYENFYPKSKPLKFTGYQYETYLKLAVMNDQYLFSGSKGGGATMWSLTQRPSDIYERGTMKQPIGSLKPDENEKFDTNVIETDWSSLSILTFRDDRLVCKWTWQKVLANEREKLAADALREDVSIQMPDIMDVNVLRPNHRVGNNC